MEQIYGSQRAHGGEDHKEQAGASQNTDAIITMFSIVAPIAGMKKWPRALSMPITAAARDTNRMKGKSSRVSCTVSSNLPGMEW